MSLPNIPTQTLGGTVFWATLKRRREWKLQRNSITGHYRILDPNSVRQAWGYDFDNIRQEFDMFTDFDS